MTRGMAVGLVGLVVLGAGLRLYRLGAHQLSFDESFTAMAARRPLGDLLHFLRYHDTHPPLDYLMRAPAARAGATEGWLRLPSVLWSIAAVGLVAWWMRHLGMLGIATTALAAVGSYQLTYGREARMYAPMLFVGVAGAWAADRFLASGERRWAGVAGGALLMGLLTHVSALALAVGLLGVAGLRRDREAWWWRAAITCAVTLWAVTWSPSFADQARVGGPGWIPFTTLRSLGETLDQLVNLYRGLVLVTVFLAGLGAVALVRHHPRLGRVWLWCFVVPTGLIALVGIRAHVLLPRTLAFASWGPLVALAALAALVDDASRRDRRLGLAVAAVVAALVLPSSVDAFRDRPTSEPAIEHVEAVAADGDAVAIRPAFLRSLVEWYFVVRGPAGTRELRLAAPGNTAAYVLGRGPWSGRVWLIDPVDYGASVPAASTYAPVWAEDYHRVWCLDL